MSLAVLKKSHLKGVVLLQPQVCKDERGWLLESFKMSSFEKLGISSNFKQDNHTYSSKKGILRGLHYQLHPHAQGKLVRCTLGKILDVVVDIRKNSPTFSQWASFELSSEKKNILWVPEGFAHGFLTLSEISEVQYKLTSEYNANLERSIRWDDPNIEISWSVKRPIVSKKDALAPMLKDAENNFI